jgi:N utilization substance protein B
MSPQVMEALGAAPEEQGAERVGTPVTGAPEREQTLPTSRAHLTARVAREASIWALCALEARDPRLSPFEITQFHVSQWRGDAQMWRHYFSAARPRERMEQVWGSEALWGQVTELTEGCLRYKGAIDALISRSSQNWRLHRMGEVDRNILRLATYELCFRPKVPAAAVLNEAIEFGKRYGTAESGRFINGVLDRVAQELGRVRERGHRPHASERRPPEVEVVSLRGPGRGEGEG